MSQEQALPEEKALQAFIQAEEVDAYINKFLDAVCDKKRRAIVELLAAPSLEGAKQDIEMRSGDIARGIGLSAATTSEHLRQLTLAGLLNSRREGNTIYYTLCSHKLVSAFRDLVAALDSNYHAYREV